MSNETLFDAFEPFFQEVIDAMKEKTFNSHEFIRELSRRHQREYIEALYEYRNGTPFKVVHGVIAKRLADSGLVKKIGEVKNEDMFGGMQYDVSVWEKIE